VLLHAGPLVPALVKTVTAPSGNGIEPPAERNVNALIDTGASSSCIDEKLAAELNLPIIDRKMVGGVAGQQEHKVYLAELMIPSLQMLIKGSFVGVDIEAMKDVVLEGPSQVIVGRDFLSKTIMIYDGVNGSVTISC
jgi:predicted aspartyl protease